MLGRTIASIILLAVMGCQASATSSVPWTPDGDDLLGIAITNQSFERPSVDLTVQIDGVDAITGTYLVENQHVLHYYELQAAGGARVVTVTSEHGERASIEVEAGGSEPWVYASYWGAEGSDPFNLRTTAERPAMALPR